ncbi:MULTISPECIES: hypothetical protein [Streptomyces]|uniref:Integral membrane protein n=1 Tax=Streptomyces mordarskii TaxID=1226758 RepID=A0ABP3MPZ5_9ACTN|nr:hypothetical protein [Streptomyces sp. AgN23]QTI89692.1 hypothetical protein AS97_55265 [Streptomyces sp. AgN23]WTA84893.1 hypothetical protein OG751_36280 [Streptomyces antimycoticus]WTB04608.1 hypothetical protein OG546_10465 [Streptomyces antimycoticus]
MIFAGAALLLLVFVLVKSVRLLRARAFSWRDPRAWSAAAAVCLGITFFVYMFGALSGFTQTSEICAVKSGHGSGKRPDSVTETAFPLSHECRWNDGITIDLVPAWVNPVVFVFAAGFVLCSAKAVHAAITSRTVTSRTGASS